MLRNALENLKVTTLQDANRMFADHTKLLIKRSKEIKTAKLLDNKDLKFREKLGKLYINKLMERERARTMEEKSNSKRMKVAELKVKRDMKFREKLGRLYSKKLIECARETKKEMQLMKEEKTNSKRMKAAELKKRKDMQFRKTLGKIYMTRLMIIAATVV
jgi:hypothetical protein